MEMKTPCGAFFCGDLQADASIGPYGENVRGRIWNPLLPIRQSVSHLWYFIPALIVQAR